MAVGRKSNPTPAAAVRVWTNSEWADAVALHTCEVAEGRGWLGAGWRTAWWLRGGDSARVAAWQLVGEAGDVVAWQDSERGGCVWVALSPDGAHLRLLAVSGPDAAVEAGARPWDAVRAASLDDERGAWLYWWEAMAWLRGRAGGTGGVAAEVVGQLGVYELEGGGVAVARIAEVERGRVVALERSGARLAVRRGGRGWPWRVEWQGAALRLVLMGKWRFESVDSALWTLVHLRNRLKKAGALDEEGRLIGATAQNE